MSSGFHDGRIPFFGRDDHVISGVTNRLALPFSAHFHLRGFSEEKQLQSFINTGTLKTPFVRILWLPYKDRFDQPQLYLVRVRASHSSPMHNGSVLLDEQCEEWWSRMLDFPLVSACPIKKSLLAGKTCQRA